MRMLMALQVVFLQIYNWMVVFLVAYLLSLCQSFSVWIYLFLLPWSSGLVKDMKQG